MTKFLRVSLFSWTAMISKFFKNLKCFKQQNKELEKPKTTPNTTIMSNQEEVPENSEDLNTQDILQLPLARIKKIFASDRENQSALKKAHIAVGLATQVFVDKLVDQALAIHNLNAGGDKVENKITYDDLAAVANIEPFVFLKLLIPERVSLINAYNEHLLRFKFVEDGQKPEETLKNIGLMNEKGVLRDVDFSESDNDDDAYKKEEVDEALSNEEEL